jgi:hypothetical protein
MLAGAGLLIGGLASASAAASELDEATVALEAQTEATAQAAEAAEAARQSNEAAQSELVAARNDLAAAQGNVARLGARLPKATQEAGVLASGTSVLIDAASRFAGHAATAAEIRLGQVAAVADAKYRGYNELQVDYNELVPDLEAALDELANLVARFKIPGSRPALDVGELPTFGVVEVELDPPTGPAKVKATLPEVIPCTPYGDNGCSYTIVIHFAETNMLEATVERMAVRYIERGGRKYWYRSSGEWWDTSLEIDRGGTASHTLRISTDDADKMKRIMGGTVKFRFRGHDADGNSISGTVTARLERP